MSNANIILDESVVSSLISTNKYSQKVVVTDHSTLIYNNEMDLLNITEFYSLTGIVDYSLTGINFIGQLFMRRQTGYL